MTYYLLNGDTVTAKQIDAAFNAGLAVLVHYRKENGTCTGLMIDGEHFDTRGECFSAWDESWTSKPESLTDALAAAKGD